MSDDTRRDPAGNLLGGFIVELFRLNGILLAEGDKLTRDLGLTSARWQVLGALGAAERRSSVAQIARNMGLTRQSVQRIANELCEDELVKFEGNPDHHRAKFVVPKVKGRLAFRDAMLRQSKWAKAVLASACIKERTLRLAEGVLRDLRLSITELKK